MKKIKKKYLVFDVESHEFDLVVTKWDSKTKLELFYSENEAWSEHVRGTSAMKVISNGNGFKLSKKYHKFQNDEICYLRFLLNFEVHIDENEANKRKYKIIDSEITFEI